MRVRVSKRRTEPWGVSVTSVEIRDVVQMSANQVTELAQTSLQIDRFVETITDYLVEQAQPQG